MTASAFSSASVCIHGILFACHHEDVLGTFNPQPKCGPVRQARIDQRTGNVSFEVPGAGGGLSKGEPRLQPLASMPKVLRHRSLWQMPESFQVRGQLLFNPPKRGTVLKLCRALPCLPEDALHRVNLPGLDDSGCGELGHRHDADAPGQTSWCRLPS